jgi:hypothetical protein
MKSNWLSKIMRTQIAAALALGFATVTVSTAATSERVKRGQVHFEYVVPQNTQQDDGWYKPARSPQFSSFLQ